MYPKIREVKECEYEGFHANRRTIAETGLVSLRESLNFRSVRASRVLCCIKPSNFTDVIEGSMIISRVTKQMKMKVLKRPK